ncbi:hypothetical protein LTR62_001280 [Meristemomyces frigidus]|uniref:Heterokaryon incompatibility domain-containing protein n=1 Tax=Meristemomyces frigidus TaxID=1508187 RepID=A0AAN7T9F9_9PEZI|nr:hypothetical protein LTR62_001280 [Meristemomyces frigidus]
MQVARLPHEDLSSPLGGLEPQEIRVLVLKPEIGGAPVYASVESVKLQPRPGPSTSSRSGYFHRSQEYSEGTTPSAIEITNTKFVVVGSMLYPVPLDYSGDGSEFTLNTSNDSASTQDYEAISYVWGAPVYSQQITIEDHGLLRITQSLYDALQRLRYADRVRRLWADAICINQADLDERSAQVSIMDQVYQQARAVPVWLGPAEESDALAFAAMALYLTDARGDDAERIWHRLDATLRNDPHCPRCFERFELVDNLAAEALLAIARVLQRSWFTRLWVVQETATSAYLRDHATVYCSSHHISYLDLRDAARMIQSDAAPRGMLRVAAPVPGDMLKQVVDLWSDIHSLSDWYADIEERAPNYLLRTLSAMSLRTCSNPSDRVYAVRALLNLQHEPSLMPDYSLAPEELYRRLVVVLLKTFLQQSESDVDQPWALLALAGTTGSTTGRAEGWPSWVVDLNALTVRSRCCIELYTSNVWLEIPQFLPAPHWFDKSTLVQGAALKTRALCFATVKDIFKDTEYPVLSETHSDRISKAELTIFRSWYVRCLQCIGKPALADEEVIAHSTTFLACGTQLAHLPREMEEIEEAIDYSGGWLTPETWPEDPNEVREHFMLLSATANGPPDKSRLLARITVDANQGAEDYCWVPPAAKPGDQVSIVAGATFPFVLRALPNGGFRLVGDAYLANTTLKQALGGGGKSRWEEDIYEDINHPATDDWDAEDGVMQESIGNMGSVMLL